MSSAYRTQGRDASQVGSSAASGSHFATSKQQTFSPQLPRGFRFVTANAGDHVGIQKFLVTVLHGPNEDEFASALDEPYYEPSDRLLIKRGETIVAHVFTRMRVLRMGQASVPVGQICQLAALPEYRGLGFRSYLLLAAEQSIHSEGAALAVMRTKLPDFFRPLGWGSYVPYCLSKVGLRALLRELTEWPQAGEMTVLRSRMTPKLDVRPWRQIELNDLRALYDAELCEKVFGVWARSEAQWRWLIERRNHDRIYVATQQPADDGPEKITKRGRPKTELDDVRPPEVVAYAVQRADQVFELVAREGKSAYSKPLLARICADALERGFHELTLHAQPDDPMHAWFNAAGRATQHLDNLQGEFLMGKILDIDRLLQLLLPTLSQRLTKKIPEQWHLGMCVGNHLVLLKRGRQSLQIVPNATSRNHVEMSPQTFLSLVCGQLDPQQAAAAGALTASTKLAKERVSCLFCRVPFAWPAWDD